MSKKASPRVTNSFSQEETEVMAYILEKAPMLAAYETVVRKPAFSQLYAKVHRMRASVQGKKANGKEAAHAV